MYGRYGVFSVEKMLPIIGTGTWEKPTILDKPAGKYGKMVK